MILSASYSPLELWYGVAKGYGMGENSQPPNYSIFFIQRLLSEDEIISLIFLLYYCLRGN